MGVLVGDVGGTKTVLALGDWSSGRFHLDHDMRLASGDFASLEALVHQYLSETHLIPDRAAFAVAGPVREGRCDITNLPWFIDQRQLKMAMGWHDVCLLNDLEAVAWGIPALGPEDFAILQQGEEGTQGNACVIAAGTGLGQAGLFWDGRQHHPFATEGGHSDFAPETAQEVALLDWLRQRHGHVSWERVVSGLGLRNIFEFLLSQAGLAPGDSGLVGEGDDLGAAIAAGAASGACPLCVAAMALFARLYGREAGNLALKHLALGGVYLGGGIASKNLELLRGPDFLAAFLGKGRMEPLLRRMSVKVILNPHAPLYGAARYLDYQTD